MGGRGQQGCRARVAALLAGLAGWAVLCEAESPASLNSLGEDLKVMQNIGYYMQIGQAFDMRSGEPVSALVSSPDAIDMHTVEMDTPLTSQSYALDDSWESKAKMMSLDVEAELNMIGGAAEINIAGGINYLKDKRSTSKSISMAYSCLVHTKTRTLDAFHPDIRSSLNRKLIDSKLATHVVTGITYGQRTVATFKSTFKDEEEKEDLGGFLKIGIKTATFEGKLEGSLQMNNAKHNTNKNIESTVYTDSVPDGKLPTEFEETLEFVKTAYLRLNGEIGVPLTYTLTPLKKLDSDAAVLAAALKDGDVIRARAVYQGLSETELELGDLLRLRPRGNSMWLEQAVQLNNEFAEFRLKLLSRLGAALTRMRRGDTDGESVPDVLDAYYASDFEQMKARLKIGELEDRLLSFTQIVAPGDPLGVRVAESRSDFMGPVLDMTNDNTYALMVVDADRAQGDLQTTVAFYDYARSTFRPGKGNCVWNLPEDKAGGTEEERQDGEVCQEDLAFVAAHFDSLCETVCPSKYCFKFDPSPEKRHITRACSTLLDSKGKPKLPGACMPSDELAAQWNCWKRPVPDAPEEVEDTPAPQGATPAPEVKADDLGGEDPDADKEKKALAVFKKKVRAFPEDWCACPSTQIVQFKRTGEDMKVDVNLIAVPRAVDLKDAISEPVNKLKPENQHVLLHVKHPEGQDPESMLRHKVVVLYNLMDEETGEWYEVSRTFETYTNALPIRVTGLRAGWRYRFKVAGVNEFGAGPMSVLSDMEEAGENIATPTAVHGSKRVKGKLPDWEVGGLWEMELDIKLSAQHGDKITSVVVTEKESLTDPGFVIPCIAFASTRESVRCRIDLRETGPHTGKTLHVKVADDSGEVAATGLLDVVAASEEMCTAFEEDGRALLCEAELVHAETDVQMDPLNQKVELIVKTDTNERGPRFAGWKVTAVIAGDDTGAVASEASVYGAVSEVEMWGLTAGERYVFHLAALGEEDQTTAGFPEGGFRVGVRMPVLKHRPGPGEVGSTRQNSVPGWDTYNGGKGFPVTASLSVPAETKIGYVELKVSPEGEDIWVQCTGLKPVAGKDEVECVVPIARMVRTAQSQDDMEIPDWIPLRALDVSRRLLGEGFVEWNDISEESCAEFEMRASSASPWLLCQVNGNEGVTETCVRPSTGVKKPCDHCAGGQSLVGRKCTNVMCAMATDAYCPTLSTTNKCIKADDAEVETLEAKCRSGCGADTVYHPGMRLCALPCKVTGYSHMASKSVAPGTTLAIRFCENTNVFEAQRWSSRFVVSCPSTNMVSAHTASPKPVWFRKAQPPSSCVACSRAGQCSGASKSWSAYLSRGQCRCSCKGVWDRNNNCATCRWPYVEESGKCIACTRGYCRNGWERRDSPTKCRCQCYNRHYYGAKCELYCPSGRYYHGRCLRPYNVAWHDRRACAPGLKKIVYLPSRNDHWGTCQGGWVDEWRWSSRRCTLGLEKWPTCSHWRVYWHRDYAGGDVQFYWVRSLSQCSNLCCHRSWCKYWTLGVWWWRPWGLYACWLKHSGQGGRLYYNWRVATGQVASHNRPHVCYYWPRNWWTHFCSRRRKRCAIA